MITTLFDLRPPEDDAAPQLWQASGAGVENPKSTQEFTRLLLTPPGHRNAPAGTCDAAARHIADQLAKQRSDVQAGILKAGTHGATDAKPESGTDIQAQSVGPRHGELRVLGLILDSGRRRPTPRGCSAAVWSAETFGTAEAGQTCPSAAVCNPDCIRGARA